MKDKDGRYVIDETNILPDLLEEKLLYYVSKKTKELFIWNSYDQAMALYKDELFFKNSPIVQIQNTKAAKILYNTNRQKLPKKE